MILTALSIILTWQAVFSIESAEVRLDLLTAVVKLDYWVRASLRLDKNAIAIYRTDFIFNGLGQVCVVKQWRLCNRQTNKNPGLFTCDCSSRKIDRNKLVYRFYFYIGAVKHEYSNKVFRAELQNICWSEVKLHVTQFESRPKTKNGYVTMCRGTQTILDWKYSPSPESYLLSKVMEDYIDKVRLDGTKSAPYLRVLKHFTENKTRVQIVIKFNERRYHAVKTPKQIPWKRGTLKGSPIRTGRNVRSKRQNQGRAPTTAPYTTNVYATTAKTTTNKTTTTTTPSTSTVPTLEYDEEKDTLGPLTDSVMFLPLVPPATYLETTIHTTSHTITDSFLVLCSIPRGYLGLPPINMSIWQIEKDGKRKLLSTKQGTLNLRYNPLYSQITKYSCSLEGPALECLGKNEPPRRSSVAKITDSLKEAEDNNIDWFLILYGSEILAVIYILLWTISNFIQHLRLIMWGHRMLLEEQEGYLKRVNLMPANESTSKNKLKSAKIESTKKAKKQKQNKTKRQIQ